MNRYEFVERDGQRVPVTQEIENRAVDHYIEQSAKDMATQRRLFENMPPFEDMTLDDVFNEEPMEWVLPGVLPIGVVGLAGPAEAGKSLFARDWINSVANGVTWRQWRTDSPRQVTYCIGEGRSGLKTRFHDVVRDNIRVTSPVCLTVKDEVDRFIKLREGTNTGLVVFDMIYHMGIGEENSASETFPLLNAARRISDELNACVLLIGHPGHNGARRFRGTSSFRGFFDAEYHVAENIFTCEKMKDSDGTSSKQSLGAAYEMDYPHVRWLRAEEAVANEATRRIIVQDYLNANPGVSQNQAAVALMPRLDLSLSQAKRIIRAVQQTTEDD